MKSCGKAFLLGIFFAVVTAIAALSYTIPSTAGWRDLVRWGASVGCFGFLVGGICAFDPESELKVKSSALGRATFGVIAALLLSALWHWPVEGVAFAALLAAVLGYLGMLWVRHVPL
jgi:peptidoglycan/LPS O-acetylase OafA/YrhL